MRSLVVPLLIAIAAGTAWIHPDARGDGPIVIGGGSAVGAVSGAGVNAGSGFGFGMSSGAGGWGGGGFTFFSTSIQQVPPPMILFAAPHGGVQPPAPVPFEPGPIALPEAAPAPMIRRPWSPPMPVRRVSQEKVDLWLTYGDNLFRAGNLPRAEDRYEQALKARPTWSRPRIRLAEIAVARGDYREAAARFREAHAADPGWLVAPDDVQALWPEPRDFAAMLGKIETHLQAHPEDRDAWLVLGAQLLLSGRRDRAADTLVRLTDQPPDPALALLLRASGL